MSLTTHWAVRDALSGAVYPQPNKLIAEKVAEWHGNCDVIPIEPPADQAWLERVNRALFKYDRGELDVRGVAAALIPEPPTDDERAAIVRILDDASNWYYTGSHTAFVPERGADAILASPEWRNRHRGPITEEEALRLGKVAWVAHNGGEEWARSVVDDCFSPADDLPEEALDMIAVARAVLEAAEAMRHA